eukprot:Lithocolla_globosa_v1_NODE_2694_length_1902_cov_13.145100.p2 type:complete len:162 gc:universal NODE_2694_length_1902_cov_13.145100:1067-582(-)
MSDCYLLFVLFVGIINMLTRSFVSNSSTNSSCFFVHHVVGVLVIGTRRWATGRATGSRLTGRTRVRVAFLFILVITSAWTTHGCVISMLVVIVRSSVRGRVRGGARVVTIVTSVNRRSNHSVLSNWASCPRIIKRRRVKTFKNIFRLHSCLNWGIFKFGLL